MGSLTQVPSGLFPNRTRRLKFALDPGRLTQVAYSLNPLTKTTKKEKYHEHNSHRHDKFQTLSLAAIRESTHNPRCTFDPAKLGHLSPRFGRPGVAPASLRTHRVSLRKR